MTLKEKINSEFVTAFKEKNTLNFVDDCYLVQTKTFKKLKKN